MTFGEKVKQLRLVQNLSQSELAEKTGISARSLYTYEQTGTMPRSGNIRKIADALHVSVSYLLDEEETDLQKNVDQDIFIANFIQSLRALCRRRAGRCGKGFVFPVADGSLFGVQRGGPCQIHPKACPQKQKNA